MVLASPAAWRVRNLAKPPRPHQRGDVRLKADLMTAGFDITKADFGLGIVHDAV